MLDQEATQRRISRMRALIQDGRARIAHLRPAWSAHLADETMCRLREALDALEAGIGLPRSADTGAGALNAEAHRGSEPA